MKHEVRLCVSFLQTTWNDFWLNDRMKSTLLFFTFLSFTQVLLGQINSDTSKVQVVNMPPIEASFPGGVVALKTYLKDNITYPKEYSEISIVGKIYVSFYIEVDGAVSEVEIVRGIDGKLDEIVKKMIYRMPKWQPAKDIDGSDIRSRVLFPVHIP